MTEWKAFPQNKNMLYGFGIFGYADYHGLGEAIYYNGNMLACQMFIIKLDHKIYYFHTAHAVSPEELMSRSHEIISIVQQ